ncbi:hypothetical protein GE21DRAFT_1283986 [Neurospora crassa]|nr:hypothetical protein GE21DRAFT_1283986 [Neurospora crassa]
MDTGIVIRDPARPHRYAGDRQSSRRNIDNRCFFIFFLIFFLLPRRSFGFAFQRKRKRERGRDNPSSSAARSFPIALRRFFFYTSRSAFWGRRNPTVQVAASTISAKFFRVGDIFGKNGGQADGEVHYNSLLTHPSSGKIRKSWRLPGDQAGILVEVGLQSRIFCLAKLFVQ